MFNFRFVLQSHMDFFSRNWNYYAGMWSHKHTSILPETHTWRTHFLLDLPVSLCCIWSTKLQIILSWVKLWAESKSFIKKQKNWSAIRWYIYFNTKCKKASRSHEEGMLLNEFRLIWNSLKFCCWLICSYFLFVEKFRIWEAGEEYLTKYRFEVGISFSLQSIYHGIISQKKTNMKVAVDRLYLFTSSTHKFHVLDNILHISCVIKDNSWWLIWQVSTSCLI